MQTRDQQIAGDPSALVERPKMGNNELTPRDRDASPTQIQLKDSSFPRYPSYFKVRPGQPLPPPGGFKQPWLESIIRSARKLTSRD